MRNGKKAKAKAKAMAQSQASGFLLYSAIDPFNG